jgi:type I restriction enzyme S subunit
MRAGWKTVKLNDVCDIVKGRKPNLRTTPNKGDLPYLVARYIRGLEDPEYGSPVEKGVVTLTEADTVIICDGSNSGEIFTGLNGIMSSTMGKVVKKTEIYDPYLRHFLSSTFELFNGTKTGSAIPHLDKDAFRKLEIPLPPLAEQKRIVALLDEAFAGIDEAKAKAESNDQAAADFLESRLSELFLKPEETPSMISDHCTDVTVGYVGPMADKYVPNGIPFLRSQNVRPFEINFENLMQITPAFEKSLSKSRLAPGDVVVVRTGYPGTAAVIPAELPIANCADLVILRPMKSLDPNYLVAFFNSKVGKDMVLGRLVGAAQKHFNVGAAKSVLLPIPNIQMQREVVSHIFEIRTHVGKLMDNSKAKLSELSELKASILAQAFAGELTA